MAEGIAGDQWNEGDVSCSVVRRAMLPDSFFAIDGLLETALTVLDQMEVFPAVIDRENNHYLPFLATTTILMVSVKNGAGREVAHEAIKEHAVATVLDLRAGKISENDLVSRLASDDRIGLSEKDIRSIIDKAHELTGMAGEQVDEFIERTETILDSSPKSKSYNPATIL